MDVAHYEYVIKRDPQLRGLVLLPFAALFYLSAAWSLRLVPLPGGTRPPVPGRWFMLGFVLALAASWAIRAWYIARYGKLTQIGQIRGRGKVREGSNSAVRPRWHE